MKTAVITIDWENETIIPTFCEGENSHNDAEKMLRRVRRDFQKPRYNSLLCRDDEANKASAKEHFGVDLK